MNKTVEPITDDAELAKVLEDMQPGASGANDQATPAPASSSNTLNFEETPIPEQPATDPVAPVDNTQLTPLEPAPATPPPATPAPATTADPVVDPTLEAIKKDALAELRPLVDKLDLPAEEKFDTLLLIIRSTDDKTLVQSAYDSAKLIADESKRAEALLDIVKEIDYFSNPSNAQPAQ